MKKNYLLFIAILIFTSKSIFSQQTIYVSSSGAGDKNGTSESNAYAETDFGTALSNIDSATDILRIIGDITLGTNYDFNSKQFPFTIEGDSNGSVINGTDGKLRLFTITANDSQDVTFKNLIFKNFTNSTGQGGVFYSQTDGEITFQNCVFVGNSSINSSGGGAVNITALTTANFTNCTFYNNANNTGVGTTGQGGAIFFGGGLTAILTNCTFYQNTISRTNNDFGAAIRIDGSANVTMSNCLFYDNKINNGAGGVADVGASAGGTQNFNNSLGQLINANIDNVSNSIVLKKTSSGTGVDLTTSSLSWNATEYRVEFTAPSLLTDNTPIDFGSDKSDVGAWDSKINLFKGTTDSDWATGTNWSSTAAPTSLENVTLLSDSPALVIGGSTNATINNLSVDAASSLTINSGGSLIVNGTSTGNVTYNRNLATTNWYLVSSPISGQAYNDGFVTANGIASGTGNNRGIATYTTASNTWSYLQSAGSGTFNNGQGYSVKRNSIGNVSFSGTINTADVSVAVSNAGNGFNLIGNPFTSHLNSASLLGDNSANLVSQTLWVWNQATSSYDTYVTGDSFVLAPTQGFFVRSNNGTNLNIAESYQASTGGTFQKTLKTEVKLLMNDGTADRFAKIYYLDNATKGFDNGFDGETFGGIENTVDVFTNLLENNEGKKYQVQSLPISEMETMIVPVGVKAAAGKEITFSAEALNLPNDLKVFLEDRLTNTFTRLDEANASYKVTLSDALNGTGRFFLHTKSSAVLSTDDIALQNTSVYAINNNTLRVVGLPSGNANVKMYSILGKQVMQTSFSSTGVKDISLPKLATGMYIIQLETATGKLNKKIVLE